MKTGDSGDRAPAARAVGTTLRWRELARDEWGWRWLDDLASDVRYACRVFLRRDRAFAVAAITMLALAIGLNVIVFTVVDAMLFRGFPLVKRNDQLVAIQEVAPTGYRGFLYPDYQEWRAQAHSFEDIGAVMSGVHITFRNAGTRPTDLVAWKVTANTLGLLGVAPALGRDFVAADEAPGAPPVVILNDRLWSSQFGKRTDVVGSTVYVNGAPATIVGVMPERFDFPHRASLWMPVVRTADLQQRGSTSGGYLAFGRLRPAATFEKARTELETINSRLQVAFPATNRDRRLSVVDNVHFHAGPNGPVIYGTLWAGACFVLLIACANVANLTLVRTIGRWPELSTRMALGAGLARMTRQILVEGLILSSIAGALGWWIATWGIRMWAAATASPFQVLDYTVDSGTLAYLAGISATAAALFSLAPIVRVVQLRASGALRGDGRGITRAARGRRLAAALVAGQMALAVVLLSAAGVLVRSLMNIVGAETGVRDPGHLLIGFVRLPPERYATPDARLAYYTRLDIRLTGVPGVDDASVSTSVPLRGGRTQAFEIEGRPAPGNGAQVFAQFLTVGSRYFRVVGALLVAGRDFDDRDRIATPPVAIVNQSMVEKFWPGEPPVGRRLRVIDQNQPGEWRTVVGVVSNIMEGDPIRQQFKPVVYLPIGQAPPTGAQFLARTRVPPSRVAHAIRAAVETIDPDVTVDDFATFTTILAFDGDYTDLQHMELGKGAAVAPIFALVALLLAAIGLYAVIAHSVRQRTQEIGIRVAIGAAARDIRRLVFRSGVAPVALGVTLGLAGSLAVNRVLQSQLVGVSPHDPATISLAVAVLLSVAFVACQIPARRAARVDPVIALRHE
jgi:putative ABC transport system permease protein